MSNESTVELLEKALQFASALAANGASVPDELHNALTFSEIAQTNALKGHPGMMLDRAQQLQAALDALSAPAEA